MSTKWVVTAASERVVLDQRRRGEATFTVTNPADAADRAVFDVVPGEGAGEGWFTVEEPQRLVRPGASVAYSMKVTVPEQTPSGTYDVRGRIYSVDTAPEESSVLSPRVALVVPEAPEPQRTRVPWWLIAIAAAVLVLVLVVVAVLVFGGDDEPQASLSPQEVEMPEVVGRSERQALSALAEAGFVLRPIRYRHDPVNADTVVRQSVPAGAVVNRDTVVDIEVAVAFGPPQLTGPQGVPIMAAGEPVPTLQWDPGSLIARRWRVLLFMEECFIRPLPEPAVSADAICVFPEFASVSTTVDTLFFEPELTFQPFVTPTGTLYHSGWVRWQVVALDDFGNAGPPSAYGVFRLAPQ